ncbi:hypothetical protein XMV225_003126 [Aliiroseovarius sp. xm-v-225]|jgi:hypothetical protein|uniref:hypothetical protein n=1 Tax=unclassified Aliiroseovarius TaxID=2623558 RepID=UPI00156A0CE6|nr:MULTISPECIES: hypothetical protein [unclassified Aliiroseovarius]NRP45936.1 hypothetical protein [Aliiroseovarius sp. xm-m-378]NRP66804.1 hypothetical protein [Aliiroseovarius sp. xm-v-225]NRP93868.1 hypothetical protein [Aliiroseovarius sp. xm-a-134]
MIVTVRNEEEVDKLLETLEENTSHARQVLRELPDDPFLALASIKFEPIGTHPIERRPLNFVEQINQTFTYLVALRATRLLLRWHPEAGGFRLAPGAHAPRGTLDIESEVPGLVGAETFAAVRPENNRKLANDIDKLEARSEEHRYAFFMSPRYPNTERRAEHERDGVQVWSIGL